MTWTPSLKTQQEVIELLRVMMMRLPLLLGIDEIIAGCEVTDDDPYGTAVMPRYIQVRIHEYTKDAVYRGYPVDVGVGDKVSVLHLQEGNRYEVLGPSGDTGYAELPWRLVSPDGTIDPVIAADNNGNTRAYGHLSVGDLAPTSDKVLTVSKTYTDDAAPYYAAMFEATKTGAAGTKSLFSMFSRTYLNLNAGVTQAWMSGIEGYTIVLSGNATEILCGYYRGDNQGTGTLTNLYGLRIGTHTNTGGGTIQRAWGLYLDKQTVGNWENYSLVAKGVCKFDDNLTVAAGKTVDGVDVSDHDHSGAGQGGTIDIEDTSTTEMDDTKVLMPDGAGGVEWIVGGGGGAPVVNGVNKTVKPGGGGDYTTIQDAVDYFKGKVIMGECTITCDAGTYTENVVMDGITVSAPNMLELVGDTRELAGYAFVDGENINPASRANAGAGTCSITYGANEIQVLGSTTDPDFDAAGVVAGDTFLFLGNDGAIYPRTVQEVPLVTNIIIFTSNVPACDATGALVVLVPNRVIYSTTGIALTCKCNAGFSVDGFYLYSTTSYGIVSQYEAFVNLYHSIMRGAATGAFVLHGSSMYATYCTDTIENALYFPQYGYISYGVDIYASGDRVGAFSRLFQGLTVTWHFRGTNILPPGYTWQGAPFGTTPGTIDYDFLNDYMNLIASSSTRYFLSKAVTNAAASWQNKNLYGRFCVGANGRMGLRFDDGTDNNYAQVFLDGTAADGTMTIKFQYRDGGGAVTTATCSIVVPAFGYLSLRLLMSYSGGNYSAYGYLYQSECRYAVNITGFSHALTWAPAAGRAGIFTENPTAGSANRMLCDWFRNEFT